MSFASNKTAYKVPQVTRGRVIVNGGYKNGGFSMYGAGTGKTSSNSDTPTQYSDIQNALNQKYQEKLRDERRLQSRIEKLDLRRAIRKKSGKLEDTEGMMYEQALIDKEIRKKKYLEEIELKGHKQAVKSGLQALCMLMLLVLLVTPYWWVPLLIYLTLR